ncbi:MAG: DUF1573 domain-containing protein [Bacteroidota bacterium]
MTRTAPYTLLFVLGLCAILLVNCRSDSTKAALEISNSTENSSTKSEQQNTSRTESPKEELQLDSTTLEKSDSKPLDSKNSSTLIPKKAKDTKTGNSSKTTQTQKPQKVNRKKPKIRFEELTWNFGEITEGDIVEKKFKFTNIGNAPLQILSTSATCGCTMPSFPFLDIAPGESNVIGVTYNSVGKDGKQTPEVTVVSNTNPKVTTIKLQGFVRPKSANNENKGK